MVHSAVFFLLAGLVIVFRSLWLVGYHHITCGSALSSFLTYPAPGEHPVFEDSISGCRLSGGIAIGEGIFLGLASIAGGIGCIVASNRANARNRHHAAR
jgi:hypothetical protein